jgi:hypothetical protein
MVRESFGAVGGKIEWHWWVPWKYESGLLEWMATWRALVVFSEPLLVSKVEEALSVVERRMRFSNYGNEVKMSVGVPTAEEMDEIDEVESTSEEDGEGCVGRWIVGGRPSEEKSKK